MIKIFLNTTDIKNPKIELDFMQKLENKINKDREGSNQPKIKLHDTLSLVPPNERKK
jgi:hypothetical protein